MTLKEKFKQETLEKVIEISFRHYQKSSVYIKAALIGKEWQQDRSYSEEDMKSFGDWCRNGLLNTEYSVDRLDKHLEQWQQFKNK